MQKNKKLKVSSTEVGLKGIYHEEHEGHEEERWRGKGTKLKINHPLGAGEFARISTKGILGIGESGYQVVGVGRVWAAVPVLTVRAV